MQIILISSRTLGASELLLLLSLFSHLFFPPLFVFLPLLLLLLFLKSISPSISSSSPSLPFISFPCPPLWFDHWTCVSWFFHYRVVAPTWPFVDARSRGGRLGGLGGACGCGWEMCDSGATFWHLSRIWAGAKLSQWSQECSGKNKNRALGMWGILCAASEQYLKVILKV